MDSIKAYASGVMPIIFAQAMFIPAAVAGYLNQIHRNHCWRF
jgi:preprotein translocase subunit SecY